MAASITRTLALLALVSMGASACIPQADADELRASACVVDGEVSFDEEGYVVDVCEDAAGCQVTPIIVDDVTITSSFGIEVCGESIYEASFRLSAEEHDGCEVTAITARANETIPCDPDVQCCLGRSRKLVVALPGDAVDGARRLRGEPEAP